MTWGPLLSAVIGAVIALGSTLLVDVRRDRSQRGRERLNDRRKQAVDFAVAIAEAHGALRHVARRDAAPKTKATEAAEAVNAVYTAREQMLIAGTPGLVVASEKAFHDLIRIRDVVRSGATLDSAEYHDAYHAYAEALWRFRLAVRADAGEPALAPEALERADWSERQRCETCQRRALEQAAPAQPE